MFYIFFNVMVYFVFYYIINKKYIYAKHTRSRFLFYQRLFSPFSDTSVISLMFSNIMSISFVETSELSSSFSKTSPVDFTVCRLPIEEVFDFALCLDARDIVDLRSERIDENDAA